MASVPKNKTGPPCDINYFSKFKFDIKQTAIEGTIAGGVSFAIGFVKGLVTELLPPNYHWLVDLAFAGLAVGGVVYLTFVLATGGAAAVIPVLINMVVSLLFSYCGESLGRYLGKWLRGKFGVEDHPNHAPIIPLPANHVHGEGGYFATGMCIRCLDAPANVVFISRNRTTNNISCGHLSVCQNCYNPDIMRTCPSCRQDIVVAWVLNPNEQTEVHQRCSCCVYVATCTVRQCAKTRDTLEITAADLMRDALRDPHALYQINYCNEHALALRVPNVEYLLLHGSGFFE